MNRCKALLNCVMVAGISCAAATTAAALPEGMPSTVYVYPYGGGATADAERTMIASLQGVVAQSSPEIYMGSGSKWIVELPTIYPEMNVQYLGTQAMLNRYAPILNGYVLYDGDATRNAANSLAGVLGAVMVDPSTESFAQAAGLTMLVDVRERDNAWVWANYGHLFNRQYLFHNWPDVTHHMRDLVAYRKGFLFFEDAEWPTYYAAQDDLSYVYGWALEEFAFFQRGSQFNLMSAAANWMENGSVLAQWKTPITRQRTHVRANVSTEPAAHYVAFVMSDGDNLQWLNAGFWQASWWGSPHRGNFTMNWDLAPEFYNANPHGFNWLYDTAAHNEHRDYFINANGPATIYPADFPQVEEFARINGSEMARTDMQVMAILDNNVDEAAFGEILADPRVMGAMLKQGTAYIHNGGQIYWYDGKPLVGVKYSMWDGFYTPGGLASALNAAPRDPRNNQDSYSIVNVHPWSTGFAGDPMSNVQDVVDQLDPAVRVVTLEEFMIHLRNNFGAPVATDCNGNNVTDLTEALDAREVYFSTSDAEMFTLNGSATVADGLVEITHGGVNEQGSVVLTAPAVEPVEAFDAAFTFRCGFGSGGEGFCFAVLDSGVYATTTVFGEQGPGADALAVEFDTRNNRIEVWCDGASCGRYTPSIRLADVSKHEARIALRNGRISVRLEVRRGVWETAFDDAELPGYQSMPAYFGFGGGTSSFTCVHQVDDLSLVQYLAADANCNEVLDVCEDGGDLNHDGVHDIRDNQWMGVCLNGPGKAPGCTGSVLSQADADSDGDVDLFDFARFQQRYMQGGEVVPDGPNLMWNADMEEGAGEWPAYWFHSAGLVSWSADHAVSPSHSLLVADNSATERGEWRSRGMVLNGEQFLRFGWFERAVAFDGEFEATIRFFDSVDEIGNAAGDFHGETRFAIGADGNSSWRWREFVVPTPPDAGSVDVVFRSLGTDAAPDAGATGWLWIDDVHVGETH